MKYWWVNQNQTHREEHRGRYLWSPVHKANGARNRYYDFLREVSPGDYVFCFFDQRVAAIGIALSFCFDAPKPAEFGTKGAYWEAWGHRITMDFMPVPRPLRPKGRIEELRPLLPSKYSPLRPETGDGLQSIYLTPVPDSLGRLLLALCGLDERELAAQRAAVLRGRSDFDGASVTGPIERDMEVRIRESVALTDTQKEQVIQARVGQGAFRRDVLERERACRVTGIRDPEHLIASHIKPWRSCTDARERVDGDNGLALAPHVDHLFDKGFVTFEDGGSLLVSPLVREEILRAFHVDPSVRVGEFRDEQVPYLAYHHDHVFRRAV